MYQRDNILVSINIGAKKWVRVFEYEEFSDIGFQWITDLYGEFGGVSLMSIEIDPQYHTIEMGAIDDDLDDDSPFDEFEEDDDDYDDY